MLINNIADPVNNAHTYQDEDLQLYPNTVRTLDESGLSVSQILNELTLGNKNLLECAENNHSASFAKLCQLEGANQIILRLDPCKYFYFISKADEIEFMCKKSKCSFKILSSTAYENLIRLNHYTLENLSRFSNVIIDAMNANLVKHNVNLTKRLVAQCAFDKYYEKSNLQTKQAVVDYDLFGSYSGYHLYVLVPLIEKIVSEKNSKYNEEQIKKLQHLHRLWTDARDIYLLEAADYEKKHEYNKIAREIAVQFLIAKIRNIESLNSDDQDLFFPGGWHGHAVMYGIERDKTTKTYTFFLWNTGEGIDKHHYHIANFPIGEQYLYQIRASWSSLSLEQIADYAFLRQLLFAHNLEYSKEGNVYSLIETQFQKRQDPYSINPLDYHYPQRRDDCSFRCLWAASADSLGRSQDRKFPFQFKSDLISKLQQLFEDMIPKQDRSPVDEKLIMHCRHKQWNLRRYKIDEDINAEIKKNRIGGMLENSRLSKSNIIQGNFSRKRIRRF